MRLARLVVMDAQVLVVARAETDVLIRAMVVRVLVGEMSINHEVTQKKDCFTYNNQSM